jgi:dolichol-phosphate mannosyltransferase
LDDEKRISPAYQAEVDRNIKSFTPQLQIKITHPICLKKLVIIPTFKEKENIAQILEAIFALNQSFHVLIIDDNSPDGTAEIVKEMQLRFPEALFLLQRSGKLGLGTAYIMGFKWAIEHDYDYIFEMDADFSHDPADLNRLYDACYIQGADLSVGSRYVPGGEIENWPLSRKIISKGGALYSKLFTWMPVNDPTAGFVCYSKKVLQAMNLDAIRFIGYAFQIEMKFASWRLGFKISEVPIVFRDREHGASKMSKGIIKEGITGVFAMQWQYIFGDYLKRIRK